MVGVFLMACSILKSSSYVFIISILHKASSLEVLSEVRSMQQMATKHPVVHISTIVHCITEESCI